MNNSKRFHISDVLSITTGFLVSRDHMDGVYKILNHMTGEELFTHQLPRAGEVAAIELKKRFPKLNEVKDPNPSFSDKQAYPTVEKVKSAIHDWVNQAASTVGCEEFDIEPLEQGVYTPKNSIIEFIEMRGGKS